VILNYCLDFWKCYELLCAWWEKWYEYREKALVASTAVRSLKGLFSSTNSFGDTVTACQRITVTAIDTLICRPWPVFFPHSGN
jgi:hypothetical protein